MRSSTFASAAALLATATAITPTTRMNDATTNLIAKRESPSVLAVRAWNNDIPIPQPPFPLPRQKTNQPKPYQGAYQVNTTLGTPGQPLSLRLDINATQHTLNYALGTQSCSLADEERQCAQFGPYYPNASSTWAYGERDLYEWDEDEWLVLFGEESDLLTMGTEGSERTLNVSVYSGSGFSGSVQNVMAASGNASEVSILNDLVDADIIDARAFSLWNNPAYRGKLTTYDLNEDSIPPSPSVKSPSYKTVSLIIGNTTITTPWRYPLNRLAGSDPDLEQCVFGPWDGGDVAGDERAIIGVEFLRNMFLAIDYDEGKVGFAELNTSPGDDDTRSLEAAEGVQGSGGDAGSEDGSVDEESKDEGDTGAAGRMSISGFGMLAVVGGTEDSLADAQIL
ncbi:aspartic peptidase domain-containing protein [Aspergillus stella-maris]|uniref:aspartic peptidase domain-containing protein n=1 Tax=Aspergillus stella-maris TaxID=1810926 RepID=UPI003CCE2209